MNKLEANYTKRNAIFFLTTETPYLQATNVSPLFSQIVTVESFDDEAKTVLRLIQDKEHFGLMILVIPKILLHLLLSKHIFQFSFSHILQEDFELNEVLFDCTH